MRRYCLLIALMAQPALAQPADSTDAAPAQQPTNYTYGWVNDLSVGFAFGANHLPAYRAFLKANNIGTPPSVDGYLNIGVGLRYQRFRILTQVGYTLLNGYPEAMGRPGQFISRQITGGNFGLLAGFDLANARNRRVFLNLGVGGVGYEFAIYRQTTQPVSVGQLPQTSLPGAIPSLVIVNTYWEVSLDYCLREKRKRSAGLTIRAGYRRGFQPQPWTSDAFTLTDAPADRISQLFAQIGYQFSTNYTNKQTQP